jgi:hypothetical protein
MASPRYPSLYQINARVWLTQLSRALGRPATLDDVPDAELERFAKLGFDWLWFLSVWQTGPEAQAVSRSNPAWRREFEETLPDLREEDIGGSGFAITGYTAHKGLGGDAALARLRERMKKQGLKLMLDFVPNHMGLGHPWAKSHPEHFIAGDEEKLAHQPQNYVREAGRIFAYGRDPYFDGWPDTLQLNYANPATREAMAGELARIAGQCDGVRCDMAMLLLPDVFERTWGQRMQPFWPDAIRRARERSPGFCFMAEVYWGREWDMQQQGFDYTYDKTLYDRLREGHARPVREHLGATLDYQSKSARFLENHDEPRAAATFAPGQHEAAAVVTFCSPGLRFFHQGQFEGRLKRISPHLVRGPDEPVNEGLSQFYGRLLEALKRPALREGEWRLLECAAAWDGNWTNDCFIAFSWEGGDGERLLAAVNYASNQSQCYVKLSFTGLEGGKWKLADLLGDATYEREGDGLARRGLFLDVPPWGASLFSFQQGGQT